MKYRIQVQSEGFQISKQMLRKYGVECWTKANEWHSNKKKGILFSQMGQNEGQMKSGGNRNIC